MKKIRLEKQFVLRLYYLTWQASRSLHKALGAPWPEFREFYFADRVHDLQELVAKLRSWSGPQRQRYRFEDGDTICRIAGFRLFLWSLAGGGALGRWKGTIVLNPLQTDYFACMLDSFVQLLGLPEKPQDQRELISLRRALSHCCSMIEHQWRIGALVRGQEQIEHFWRADWIEPLRLDELCRRAGWAPSGVLAVQRK